MVVVTLAAVALWTVVLAGSPPVALAQTPGEIKDQQKAAERSTASNAARSAVVVVEAGDSLWSISEELLGSKANPARVENLVERTHALNLETIGADPDLLLPGQRLLLPPSIRGTSAVVTGSAAANARSTSKATPEATPVAAATSDAQKTPPNTNSKARSEAAEAPAAGVPNAVDLSEVARPLPVPVARPVASSAAPISIGSFLNEAHSTAASVVASLTEALSQDEGLRRSMLGYGIILLTLLSAALMAWKLPMKRPVATKAREANPRFRYQYGHSKEHYAVLSPANTDGETAEESGEEKVTTFVGYGARPWGALALARKRQMGLRRRGPNRDAHRRKRKGLATGAYNPRIRCHLRNASPNATRKPPGVTTRPFNGTTRRSAAPRSKREASSR